MKIFCIGRNYAEHIKELGNEIPESPVIFSKPETALIRNGDDFYLPDFSQDVHYEGELVIKICKTGKNIEEKFASNYYTEVTIGIDYTARDVQQQLKTKGLPWELAKGFDGSAPIGEFVSFKEVFSDNHIDFSLEKNGIKVQQGDTRMMLYSFDRIVSFLSSYFTLKTGDLIFTGTPSGVGKVERGDMLEGFIGNQKLLHCSVK